MISVLILGFQYLTFCSCYLLRKTNPRTTDGWRRLYGRIQQFEQFQFIDICGRVCGRGTFFLYQLQLKCNNRDEQLSSLLVQQLLCVYAYTLALEPVLVKVEVCF